MELPKYSVPEYLLLHDIDDPNRYSKVTGKRKRTSALSDSMSSVSGRTGLPQYEVPESILSPQAVRSSLGDLTFKARLNETDDPYRQDNPTTISHPESSTPVYLALGAQCEAQNHSPLPNPTYFKQSEDLLRTRTLLCPSSDESLELMFQTPAKDFGIKYDCFLGMSHETFFPTPAMADPRIKASTPNLPCDSAMEQPPQLDEAMPAAELGTAVVEAAPEMCEEVPDTHSTVNTAVPLLRGESELDIPASTEVRLSYVLKAVAAAGFESLDAAVVEYYTKSLENNEWLGQEQRLSRIRRLPVLLEELHLAARAWGRWQRRNFQEQIIKSTEDILMAELEDHLIARLPDHQNSACSTEQPDPACKHKAGDEADIEAEFPNTWTLLTSLSTKYNTIASKDWQTDVPGFVGKILAAGTELGN